MKYISSRCMVLLLLSDAAINVDAFIVKGGFSSNGHTLKPTTTATTTTTTTTSHSTQETKTKLFASNLPLHHNNNDGPSLVDERLRGEDPIEFISQEVNAKMGGTNDIFNINTGIVALVALGVLASHAAALHLDVGSIMGGWSNTLTTLPSISQVGEDISRIPVDIWNSYSAVLSSSPIQTKAVTSATVYTIGDFIAQQTEAAAAVVDDEELGGLSIGEIDKPRILRSLLAGLIGHGPMSHVWYSVSEHLFTNVLHLHTDIWGTAAKVAIDQTIWGPIWNNSYILLLGLMKGNSFETIWGETKRTTLPLMLSGLKLWPLAHCVTYGLIPVENRLLWVDLVEIIWVTTLATTAAEGEENNKAAAAAAIAGDAVVVDVDVEEKSLR